MKRLVRAVIAVLSLAALSAAGAAWNERSLLPEAHDMQALGAQARERGLPILVMFSQDGCPYCTLVEEDFLEPMLRSGDYRNKVIMRRVMLDSGAPHVDFDGKPIEPQALARRYGAIVTPTVVFLDADGRELAARLVGVSTPDFYGGELDAAIDASLERLDG